MGRLIALILCVPVLVVALACGQNAPTTPSDRSATSEPGSLTITPSGGPEGDGSLGGSGSSDSLRDIVETYSTIVVARFAGVVETRDTFSPSSHLSDPPSPTGRVTLVKLTVGEVISSSRVEALDSIVLGLPGEVKQVDDEFLLVPTRLVQQADGRISVERDPTKEDQPIYSAGTSYLLFLWDLITLTGADEFGLPDFGGFAIDGGGFILPNGSECASAGPAEISGITQEQCLAAVQGADPQAALAALKGQTLEEARQKILAAIAEAPLPTPTTASTDTPAATD